MNKSLLLIISIVLFTVSCTKDYNPPIDEMIELSVSGELSEVVTEDNIYKITTLTINSVISGEDWNILFEMATMGSLEILDMRNAKIVGVDSVLGWNDDEIPEYVFDGSKTLKEVYLPYSLKTIGTEAFAQCRKLTTVHFTDSIDSIAARAFYGTNLSGVFTTPPALRVVGKQAFAETKITKVILNSDVLAAEDSMMYILNGNSVFARCEDLTEVVVKEGCTKLELGFSGSSALNKVSLPKSLKTIGHTSGSSHNYIFDRCTALETIDLPENLWFIGYNAFAHTSIKSIKIPNRVQYLWTFAFHDCALLENIQLPSALRQIQQGCFKGCTMLRDIIIPDNVIEIGYGAFENCTALYSVAFGESISQISWEAFKNCTSLRSAILLDNVETIRSSAFEGCSSLKKVVLSDKIREIEPTTFKDCIQLQDVYIGNSVTTIDGSSFFHCPALKKLVIPASVNLINDYAFAYTGITDLTVSWTTPLHISNNVFDGTNLAKAVLRVPTGTLNVYQQTSTWQNFGKIIEE